MRTRALIAGLGMLAALPAVAQDMFFYPTKGQGPDQQSRDRGECYGWAMQQTGFDPASPTAAPAPQGAPHHGGLLRGGARGALVGAAGGAIAGDTGKGAAIGAATGALFGGMKRIDQVRAERHQQAGAQSQQQAQQQTQQTQQQARFGRAVAACMQGRGYTVS